MSYRVLHLVDHLNENCGMSLSTINMITPLRKTGFEGEILSGPGSAFNRARNHEIKVSELANFSKSKTPANLFSLARQIHRYLKDNDIDIIHAHHRLLGLVGWAVARLNGIPIIHTDHNILYGKKHTSYWGDSVITVSGTKNHLEDYFNIDENKILDCYEFTNLEGLWENEIDEPGQISTIGQLGRLAEQKGQKYLLDGFGMFLDGNDKSLQLAIKGGGPLKADLELQAAELGIAENIEFVPTSDNIKSFFKEIDCFILSSIFEGTCMAVVEAAAYGLPIIATRVGAIPEYLEDGESAILIDSYSVEEIESGLQRMVALSAEERRQMAEKARHSIQTKFDPDRQASKVSDEYKRILN